MAAKDSIILSASKKDLDRFWSKVQRGKYCWIWGGSILDSGYGVFWMRNFNFSVHRFSWVLHNGLIPNNLYVCHDCPKKDNRLCINPSHLFLGTNSDNLLDASSKGLLPLGELHSQSKLKEKEVIEIYKRRSNGESIVVLGRRFGVTPQTIWAIINGITWKYLYENYCVI